MVQKIVLDSGDIPCVEIRGPRSPRLTIVDLPGLIAVNQGEDDIHIVEAITDRYFEMSDRLLCLLLMLTSTFKTTGS